MDHGQRDRSDQQWSTHRGGHDPADEEPRRPLGGGRRRGPRDTVNHRQHRQQRHHTELSAPDRDRHLVHAQPEAGDRAERAGHVAVGDEKLKQHQRRYDSEGYQRRAERDPDQVTSLAWSLRAIFLHPRQAGRARQDDELPDDELPDDGSEDCGDGCDGPMLGLVARC